MSRLQARLFGRHTTGDVLSLAAVLVLLGLVVLALAAGQPSQRRPSGGTRTTITAPLGKRTTFLLPDGSKVMLGPGSTMAYSSTFATDARRDVHLDGEAYFEVDPRRRRPFSVRAGDLIADIDAKCVVRAYPEDRHASVAVREGTAVLNEQVIRPGEVGYISASGVPVVEPADTASWFGWTAGKLTFTKAFSDALPRLSRWYDLDLRLADSAIGQTILVATLPDTMADGVLDAVALALGARIERRGRVVTFYSKTASKNIEKQNQTEGKAIRLRRPYDNLPRSRMRNNSSQ